MPGTSKRDLEDLYRARFAHFVRVAAAIAGDEEAAVDAVQDAFAAALRSRKSFRGEGPLEAWVWRIVVNQARRARRAHAVETDDDHAGAEAADPSPVRNAIAKLPERQRHVLFLRYYADLDYASIASALGIASGSGLLPEQSPRR